MVELAGVRGEQIGGSVVGRCFCSRFQTLKVYGNLGAYCMEELVAVMVWSLER